ncbi:hypothetical protein GQ597_01700 [Gilliamella sp. Pra-s65]|nr:hypothetical protein [Gilliamella sp. Pra-s65]MWP72475.1 hypothetical protein [Gilliamella sp. Pra-s52]
MLFFCGFTGLYCIYYTYNINKFDFLFINNRIKKLLLF